ncbi:BCD family MFS transporter [Aureimonas frigidaquae]|uniref:PUCC protein n=1 Tax=Aureimonas frigidaquae TaxID=424757 RepID=A0A0P0Z2G9_9HYPH|nr:BCD family MFS transporter [Aureimonas frigidaquae]BAT28291.1 PUCC protein [Aureimonas frigidaquae]
MDSRHGWLTIVRLALAQTAIGAIVVLTTSTLNRVMIVELGLAATLPSFLISLHYTVQLSRPRFGHASDVGMRRTPWILGGIALLACGALLAACATGIMRTAPIPGYALALVAFLIIGAGVGASGTALLTLAAAIVTPERRGPAATLMFTMMIAGFALTTSLAARFLEPFSMMRLIAVTGTVGLCALVSATLALWRLEGQGRTAAQPTEARTGGFSGAFAGVWQERRTRGFAYFVFLSMLAYSGQDVVLEPFGGIAFGLSPAGTTRLAAWQNGGTFLGMLVVALAGGLLGRRYPDILRWTAILGCVLSTACLLALAAAPLDAQRFPIFGVGAVLGFGLGAFTISAIGAMMAMAGGTSGPEGDGRQGLRMGVWGAAQAMAFAGGGLAAGLMVDIAGYVGGSAVIGYMTVFLCEAALFVIAGLLARRAIRTDPARATAAFRSSPITQPQPDVTNVKPPHSRST